MNRRFSDFKIGCDPEFSFIVETKDPYGVRGVFGYPAWWFLQSYAPFGREATDRGEIRPDQDPSPLVVTARIYQALKKGYDEMPMLRKVKWLAGGDQGIGPTGGHIHMSCHPFPYYDFVRDEMVPILDSFMLKGFSRLVMDRSMTRRRRAGGYGQLNSARVEDYKIEYRGLDSFLVNPKVTLASLTLAKLVFYGVMAGQLPLNGLSLYGPSTTKEEARNRSLLLGLVDKTGILPLDCKIGWKCIEQLLDEKPDWSTNMIDSWELNK